MDRITEIEIAGKKYPLNFSTKAAKEVAKRYGDVSNIGEAFTGKTTDEMMDEAIWILALLIDQGVAYKRIVDNEEIKGLNREELEVVMGVFDFSNLKNTILGAMTAGMNREVEVEIDPKRENHTGPISFVWFDFYGRILNISRIELNCMPIGEILDLIACYQIWNGAEQKKEADDSDMIPDIL